MTGELLGHAMDYMKAREIVCRPLEDDRGRYAFHCAIPGAEGYKTDVVVTAKKYLVKRRGTSVASAMERKVIERASDMDGKVVQFVANRDTFYVFDPDAWLEFGLEPDGRSTRREREDWLDLPVSWGVELDDFLDRRATPRTERTSKWPPEAEGGASTAEAAAKQKGLDRWS